MKRRSEYARFSCFFAVSLIVVMIGLTVVQNAFSWGVMPPSTTHQHILRGAYNLLAADPAFDARTFPSLEAILAHEGVNWVNIDFTGEGMSGLDVSKIEGPGPDSKGNSPFSWHYYNPSKDEGSAPVAVNRFYRYLAEGMATSKKEALPKSAAWSAHFLADMYCIYHVNGVSRATAEAIYKEQLGGLTNTEIVTLGDDIKGSVKLSYLTPIKGYSNNFHTELIRFLKTGEDWFDPWYFNGNTETMMSNMSSHIAWESTVNPAAYDLQGFAPGWENGPRSFDTSLNTRSDRATKLAKAAAALTSSQLEYWFDKPQPAVNEAVRGVYTLWRSSFSALTPAIKIKEEVDILVVTGKVTNRGGAVLENVEARLKIDGCQPETEIKIQILGGLPAGALKETGEWRVKKGEGQCRLILEAIADSPVPDMQYATVQTIVAPALVIKPDKATLTKGTEMLFKAFYQGNEMKDVIWSVKQGSVGGSIAANGLYKPPEGGGTFTILARGKTDPKLSAEATVVIPGIFLETTITIGEPKALLPFTVKVTNPPEQPVFRWDFGDGTVIDKTDQKTMTHAYAKGEYRITVTMTDGETGTMIDKATGSVKIEKDETAANIARLYCYDNKTRIEREYGYYKKDGREILHGKYMSYHCSNGQLAFRGQYRDDQPVGLGEGFDEDGKPNNITDNEAKTVVRYDYYGTRQLKSVVRTKDGKKHGLQEDYYPSGRKMNETGYEADQQSGKYAAWWENGNQASTGFYKLIRQPEGYYNSVKHGTFKEYQENGILQREENYVDGNPNGIFRRYYKNGKLTEEGEYKTENNRSNKTGVWRYYYESGAKKRQEVGGKYPQSYGVITYEGEIEWDEKGNVTLNRGVYK